MSLLDYAGSQLGWHPDWPEARPSAWHELPALDGLASALSPAIAELHLAISIPAPFEPDLASKSPRVNYCGGCFQRFEAMDAATAANALRHHIETESCAHYVTHDS
jgi:hypothetical protein